MQVIIVEGGIGVGKSALLESLAKIPEVAVVPEIVPLDKLKLFLKGKLDALGFQLIMASKRIQAQNEALEKEKTSKYVFMERSVFSDYCFASTCIKNPEDLKDYEAFVEAYLWPVAVEPDLTLYLRGSLYEETERIRERGRPGEEWYLTPEGTEYRKRLNYAHENMFLNNSDVLILNPDRQDWRRPDVAYKVWQKIQTEVEKSYKRQKKARERKAGSGLCLTWII